MTIAVALKVRDGIVLAADSATTLAVPGTTDADEFRVVNIYNHGNKIVNLHKGAPIGFMTWGLGGFGTANVETLAKDFRAEVWPNQFATGYQIADVAARLSEFFQAAEEGAKGPFGFVVAGHAPGQALGEAWEVELDGNGIWSDPVETLAGESGLAWWGQPRWIQRLVFGFDALLAEVLVDRFGLEPDQLGDAFNVIRATTEARSVHPAMPIQDAVNLGGFLVEVTKGATEFTPGHLTVGGPTEVAAITKHEGFKWVSRKHYYNTVLNPPTLEGT